MSATSRWTTRAKPFYERSTACHNHSVLLHNNCTSKSRSCCEDQPKNLCCIRAEIEREFPLRSIVKKLSLIHGPAQTGEIAQTGWVLGTVEEYSEAHLIIKWRCCENRKIKVGCNCIIEKSPIFQFRPCCREWLDDGSSLEEFAFKRIDCERRLLLQGAASEEKPSSLRLRSKKNRTIASDLSDNPHLTMKIGEASARNLNMRAAHEQTRKTTNNDSAPLVPRRDRQDERTILSSSAIIKLVSSDKNATVSLDEGTAEKFKKIILEVYPKFDLDIAQNMVKTALGRKKAEFVESGDAQMPRQYEKASFDPAWCTNGRKSLAKGANRETTDTRKKRAYDKRTTRMPELLKLERYKGYNPIVSKSRIAGISPRTFTEIRTGRLQNSRRFRSARHALEAARRNKILPKRKRKAVENLSLNRRGINTFT